LEAEIESALNGDLLTALKEIRAVKAQRTQQPATA
jgi:hypothetical protein